MMRLRSPSSDDKAPIVHLAAIDALRAEDPAIGQPQVLFEGEEEAGLETTRIDARRHDDLSAPMDGSSGRTVHQSRRPQIVFACAGMGATSPDGPGRPLPSGH